MAVSVVEAVNATTVAGSTVTPALSGTPAGGDVLVISFASARTAGARTVSSVSGCGATWAQKYSGPVGVEVWVGTGANASGTVTVTQSGAGAAQAQLFNLRGLTSTEVIGAALVGTTTNGAETGPARYARAGQFALEILSVGQTSESVTYPNGATAPATGWTTVASALSGGTAVRYAASYRIPTETSPTSHRIDFSTSGSVTRWVAQVVIGAAAATGTYADEVTTESPIVWYRLGEASGTTMNDSSGNARNGTYLNSPGLAAASLLVGDPANTCVDFDGTNDCGSTADAAWMDVPAFTVEMWVRPDVVTGTQDLAARAVAAGTPVWQLQITGGKFRFITHGSGNQAVDSTTSPSTATVYHVVATFTPTAAGTFGAGTSRIYVNGVLEASAAGTFAASDQTLRIAADSNGTQFYNGRGDEFAMYDYALSATRIGVHYTVGSTLVITNVTGEVVTETDSTVAGTIAVDYPGEVVTETDSAISGTVTEGVFISGDLVTETDSTVAGSVEVSVVGEVVTETDTAINGGMDQVIAGSIATETDSAVNGTVSVVVSVAGSIATETDSAVNGLVSLPNTLSADAVMVFVGGNTIVLDPDNVYISSAIPILPMPSGTQGVDLTGVGQRWYKFFVTDGSQTTFLTDNPSVIVTLYTSPVDEPVPATTLTQLWTTSDGNPYDLPDALTGEWVYVEVSETDSTPTDLTHVLTWFQTGPTDPIEPPYYDERLTPYDLGSAETGSVDLITMIGTTNELTFPTGSVGTGWLMWVAPFQTEFSGVFENSESFTITTYVDGVEVDERSGSTIEVDAIPVPAAGVVEFRVSTKTGGGGIDSFMWSVASEPEEPDPESIYQYLRVEVYEADGATKITELPRRFAPNFESVLNEQGAGEIAVRMDDPVVLAYKNEIFKYRNIIKFFIGAKCVFGFRVRNRTTEWVSSSEYAGLVRTLSGPSVENMLDDAIVMHDRPPHDQSLDFRKYSWASPRSTHSDANDWHVESEWDIAIVTSDLDDPPGHFTDPTTPEPVADRAKAGFPKQWPDHTAKWMFIYQDQRRNQAFGKNTRDFTAEEWANRYYRRTWFLEENKLLRFYATADDTYTLYLDGEEIIKQRNAETGYTSFNYIDIELEAGWHSVSAHVAAKKATVKVEDGNDAFLFSCMEIERNGKPVLVEFNSNESWEAYYGDDVPGWNRAHILINFWNEARRRGHHIGDYLDLGFGGNNDTYGDAWADRKWNKEVGIGTKGTELVSLLCETGGFDVWIDPGTMELNAAKKRGKNRTTSIKLEPGRNVLDWSVENIDEVENFFLVQYDGGWIEHKINPSIDRYGLSEAFISLGEVQYRAAARRIMNGLSKGLAWARTRSGSDELKRKPIGQPSGSVIAVHGAAPFFDYDVGDIILAMQEDGTYVPQRVLAISVQEDDAGALSYGLELEVTKNG